jgi:hypothetical protein
MRRCYALLLYIIAFIKGESTGEENRELKSEIKRLRQLLTTEYGENFCCDCEHYHGVSMCSKPQCQPQNGRPLWEKRQKD